MAQSKEEVVNKLVESFAAKPQNLTGEEIAVKQTIQKLALKLSEPQGSHSLLQDVPIEAIDNMAKKGQLTLIAENLDDTFLRSIESLVKNSSIEFEAQNDNKRTYEKVKISVTYEKCRSALAKEKGVEPAFHDVLLRMYTDDGPFYKKMNAIVGGYDKNPNISKATSDEEVKLAFILNVALHKAGLNKRSVEFQTTPDELFRGQSFGLENFEKKANKLDELYNQGKLATLTPAEIAEINIVDVAAKKTLSTSSNLNETANFAKTTGIVVHVKNPEAIADFYNVANISQYPKESEFISRIPDDIAMLPVRLYKDNGVSHVDVICIRSESILLQNSTQYKETRDSLKQLISEASEKIYNNSYYGWWLTNDNTTQMALLSTLDSIVNTPEVKLSALTVDEQDEILKMGYVALSKLYKTNPSDEQLQQFNAINDKLQEFCGVVANLNVVHGVHNPAENIQNEKVAIASYLGGIKNWVAKEGNTPLLAPVKSDLNMLVYLNTRDKADPVILSRIKETAERIIKTLTDDPALGQSLGGLQGRMMDIIKSVDHIECCEKLKSAPAPAAAAINSAALVKSISSSQQLKKELIGMKNDANAKIQADDTPSLHTPK